jgi:hypothetical protein
MSLAATPTVRTREQIRNAGGKAAGKARERERSNRRELS